MGLLNGLMVGIGEAGKTYGENRTLDIREAARKQAELDKEERIREASREDTALARENHLADYQTARTDKVTDEASAYKLAHSPERIDDARNEKLALMQDETDFNNKNWETKLSQATQLHDATKPVDHFDQREQDLKIKGLQKTLDSVNIPDSVKEDNKAYKDQIMANKSTRTAMQAQGTYDDKAKKALDDADSVALAQIHDNLKPYMSKQDDPMQFGGKTVEGSGWSTPSNPDNGMNDKGKYESSFKTASATYGIPVNFLKSIAENESDYRQYDKNGNPLNPGTTGAVGVMQVVPSQHPEFDKNEISTNAHANIMAGGHFVKELWDRADPKLSVSEKERFVLKRYYGSTDDSANNSYADKVNAIRSRIDQEDAAKRPSAQSTGQPVQTSTASKEYPKPEAWTPEAGNDVGYGQRPDGTNKSQGYFGTNARSDDSGKVSGELSIQVNLDGKERLIPTMVPTLTKSEYDHLMTDGLSLGDKSKAIDKSIVEKSIAHARERSADGRSPFWEEGDKTIDIPSDSKVSKDWNGVAAKKDVIGMLQASGKSSRSPEDISEYVGNSVKFVSDRAKYLKDRDDNFKNKFVKQSDEEQRAALKKAGY